MLTNLILSIPLQTRSIIGVIVIALCVSAVAYAESRRAHSNSRQE